MGGWGSSKITNRDAINQWLTTKPVNKQTVSISLCEQRSLTFPHLKPQNLKRVIPRLKEKQLQLVPRLLWRPTSTRFRGNMQVSDQGMQTCGQPPHHTPSSGHLTATFLHPRSPQARRAFTFIADVENHLHGISGRQRTASYSFFLIPDTDKEGCGGMRFSERKLPRHLSVSRILLRPSVFVIFPPTFPHKQQSAQLNGRSRGLYYTEVGGGTRAEEGGREGARSEVKDWHPTFIPPALMLGGESGGSGAQPAD